jgi:hypothetical protein
MRDICDGSTYKWRRFIGDARGKYRCNGKQRELDVGVAKLFLGCFLIFYEKMQNACETERENDSSERNGG